MQNLSALELKILTFLQQAGYPVDPATTSTVQLVRYFEAEFGCNVMGLLEQEYWEEQLDHDIVDGWFARIRSGLDERQAQTFDEVVSKLRDEPDAPPS